MTIDMTSSQPPPDRDQFGTAILGPRRLRIGWFGHPVLEILCERHDGSRFWRSARVGDVFELK